MHYIRGQPRPTVTILDSGQIGSLLALQEIQSLMMILQPRFFVPVIGIVLFDEGPKFGGVIHMLKM